MNMKIAIIILACRDYESLELTLAAHARFLDKKAQYFIIINCNNDYDSEKTKQVAYRYALLFPERFTVIDTIAPSHPYTTIKNFLSSPDGSNFELIFKQDDDIFPLTDTWLSDLTQGLNIADESTAYITPLINNNTWGFKEVIEAMNINEEYYKSISMRHRIGSGDNEYPFRMIDEDEIYSGGFGTIWGLPHVARWLHKKTTLNPNDYIIATKNLSIIEIPSTDRYSIGAILFKRDLWFKINDGTADDEKMLHEYCKSTKNKIICVRSVPFIHLNYYSQREENRDITTLAKKVYQDWLNNPWPISVHTDKLNDIEARLRYQEKQINILNTKMQNAFQNEELFYNEYKNKVGGMDIDEAGKKAFKAIIKSISRKLFFLR
jgi:hypothetical protein